MPTSKLPAQTRLRQRSLSPISRNLTQPATRGQNDDTVAFVNDCKMLKGFTFYQRQVALVCSGERTTAIVLSVADSGKKIYKEALVELTIRFVNSLSQTMEVATTTVVSSFAVPQPADKISIAYDLADLSSVAVL